VPHHLFAGTTCLGAKGPRCKGIRVVYSNLKPRPLAVRPWKALPFGRVVGDARLRGQARRILDVGVGIGIAIGIRDHDWPTDLGIEVNSGSIPIPIPTPIPTPTPRVASIRSAVRGRPKPRLPGGVDYLTCAGYPLRRCPPACLSLVEDQCLLRDGRVFDFVATQDLAVGEAVVCRRVVPSSTRDA